MKQFNEASFFQVQGNFEARDLISPIIFRSPMSTHCIEIVTCRDKYACKLSFKKVKCRYVQDLVNRYGRGR